MAFDATYDACVLHPAGLRDLLKVQPTAPNNIIVVAAVVSAKNNGIVFVRPTLGSRLEYDESVLITDPQDGDILVYNSTQGVWINQQPS